MDYPEKPLSEICWTGLQVVELPNVTPRDLAAADYADADRVAVIVDAPNDLMFAVVPRVIRQTGWPLRAGAPDLPLAVSPLLRSLKRGQRLALSDAFVSSVFAAPDAADAPLVIAVSPRGWPVGVAIADAGPDFAATGVIAVSLPESPAYGPGTSAEQPIHAGLLADDEPIHVEYRTDDDLAGDGAVSLPVFPPVAPAFPSIGDFEPERRIFSIAPKPGVCIHADGSWHIADPCPCGNQG